MSDEVLFTVHGNAALKVQRRSLEELDLEERKHLQEWVLTNPEVLGPGVLVITSEFDRSRVRPAHRWLIALTSSRWTLTDNSSSSN